MKLSWPPIVFPCVAAALGAALTTIDEWENWRPGLLPALAVIAAAVLVRLARGIPLNNPDHYDSDEIVAVMDAIKSLARSLRGLIFVTLVAMIALVLAAPILAGILPKLAPVHFALAGRIVCGLLAALVCYAFVRLIQVVQSDVSLIDRQAKMLIRAVRRKKAKAFADDVVAGSEPIPAPKGYGEPLH